MVTVISLLCRGFYFMEYWKNRSLENIVKEINGVTYTEEWKDIIGFEGLYMISTFSRVKGLYRKQYCGWRGEQLKVLPERIMKCSFTVNGYIMASLCKDANETKIFTHVLSATAFIPKPDLEDLTVDHISTIKTDNHITNLRWVTRQINSVLAASMGVNGAYKSKLTNGDILNIFKDERSNMEISKEYEIHNTTVSLIKTGRHYGYLTGKKYIRKKAIK